MTTFRIVTPIIAPIVLLACQNDGPVSDDATVAPANVVVGSAADGIAAPANSAAAEAVDRAALPPMNAGMAWFASGNGREIRYGAPRSEAMLTIACAPGGVIVTRHYPAPGDGSATLSLTGGGHVASLPVKAAPTTVGPGEAEWQGRAQGDIASAIARPFSRLGPVKISIGGAPSLVVPAAPEVRRLFAACLGD